MKTLSRISKFITMLCLVLYSMANTNEKKMKSRLFSLGTASIFFLFFVPFCNAALVNGGFETGDFSGWTLRSEGGTWAHGFLNDKGDWIEQSVPPPSQAILEQIGFFQYFSPQAITYEWFGNYSPTESQYFLEMTNADRGGFDKYFRHPDGSEYVYYGNSTLSLEQSFFMEKGDILSGTAAFSTSDFYPYMMDCAEVEINNTTIWTKGVSDVDILHIGTGGHSEWENWSWVAPESKTYTISLTMLTDDDLGSWGMFDNIKITHVPEPTTLFLLGLGLLGLAGMKRKFKS